MSELISDLEITALIHGGRGIGRHEGKAVFVPMTAPGDRVVCRVVRSKKNYAEAELVELQAPSASRRMPPCPYYGQCGGCQWQHLSYAEQGRWKEAIFADHLLRNGVVEKDVIQPAILAADEWNYRNRAQLKCRLTKTGMVMGFYQHGTHTVVDIDSCMLLAEPIQALYRKLRGELPGSPQAAAVSQVDIAVSDEGDVRVVLHLMRQKNKEMRRWLKSFAARHGVQCCLQAGRRETLDVVAGPPELTVKVDAPEVKLAYGPGGFVQVNSAQNRAMVQGMLRLLDLQGEEKILDLFCGMGNFSLPLARRAGKVFGVEGDAQAIEYARRNARANGVENAEFHVGDAGSLVSRFAPGAFDLVVLDPPRAGACDTIKELLKVMPERLLYISCDPATLSRDLKSLVKGGYEIVSAQAFDLFPQTWHIESMTLLKRL